MCEKELNFDFANEKKNLKNFGFFLLKPFLSSKKSCLQNINNFYLIREKQGFFFWAEKRNKKRFFSFFGLFVKNGKKLRFDLIFLKFVFFCRFKHNIVNLISIFAFLLENLEPFFSISFVKRYGKKFYVPCSISLQKRKNLSNRFFMQAILKIKNQKKYNFLKAISSEFTNALFSTENSNSFLEKKKYSERLQEIRLSSKFIKTNVSKISYK